MQMFILFLGIAGIFISSINLVSTIMDNDYLDFIEWLMMLFFIIITLLY